MWRRNCVIIRHSQIIKGEDDKGQRAAYCVYISSQSCASKLQYFDEMNCLKKSLILTPLKGVKLKKAAPPDKTAAMTASYANFPALPCHRCTGT
jgi:hypothetical protein